MVTYVARQHSIVLVLYRRSAVPARHNSDSLDVRSSRSPKVTLTRHQSRLMSLQRSSLSQRHVGLSVQRPICYTAVNRCRPSWPLDLLNYWPLNSMATLCQFKAEVIAFSTPRNCLSGTVRRSNSMKYLATSHSIKFWNQNKKTKTKKIVLLMN